MIKEENGELARTLLLLLFTTGDEGDIGIRRLDAVGEAARELSHEDEDELGIRHMDVVGEAARELSHEDEGELGILHMDVVGEVAGEEEEERDGSEMWECLTVGKGGSGREK